MKTAALVCAYCIHLSSCISLASLRNGTRTIPSSPPLLRLEPFPLVFASVVPFLSVFVSKSCSSVLPITLRYLDSVSFRRSRTIHGLCLDLSRCSRLFGLTMLMFRFAFYDAHLVQSDHMISISPLRSRGRECGDLETRPIHSREHHTRRPRSMARSTILAHFSV